MICGSVPVKQLTPCVLGGSLCVCVPTRGKLVPSYSQEREIWNQLFLLLRPLSCASQQVS